MAGYSDRVLRDFCRNFGADIVFTEMINCNTVINVPKKAKSLLQIEGEEHPIAVQLFGSKSSLLSEAAAILEEWGVDYIDLNVGCPVRKIVKTGAGSALLKNLDQLKRIITSMRESISKAYFSIKIRAGWTKEDLVYNEVGKIAEENGVDLIIFHARTRSQKFAGAADWKYIKELSKNVTIPVVGNGDIKSKDEAYKHYENTGIYGVMIGRKAIERPYIFKEIKLNKEIKYSKNDIKKFLLDYYKKEIELKGEYKAINEMRKIAHKFIRGWRYAKKYRELINKTNKFEDIKKILEIKND